MLGLGLVLCFVKDMNETNLQKGKEIALLVGAVAGLVITALRITSGVLRGNWWIAIVVYTVLGIAYAYLVFLHPGQLSQG